MRTSRPDVLEPLEQVVDARRLGARLGVEGDPLHDRADLLERLKVPTVVEPRVARPDPADPIRLDAVVQQPDARVHGRLARSEDRVADADSAAVRQVVDRDDSCGLRYLERRNVGGRDRRLQVAGVDDLAAHPDVVDLSGAQGPGPALRQLPRPGARGREQADPARPREPRRRRGEVLANLLAGRPLVVARRSRRPGRFDLRRAPTSSHRSRRTACAGARTDTHAANDPPAPARRSTDRHFDIGLGHQRVREGEAARARSHDEIVGVRLTTALLHIRTIVQPGCTVVRIECQPRDGRHRRRATLRTRTRRRRCVGRVPPGTAPALACSSRAAALATLDGLAGHLDRAAGRRDRDAEEQRLRAVRVEGAAAAGDDRRRPRQLHYPRRRPRDHDQPARTATAPALCDGILDYVEQRVFPGGCFFVTAAAEMGGRHGPVRDRVARYQRQWRELLLLTAHDAHAAADLPRERDPRPTRVRARRNPRRARPRRRPAR